MPHAPRPFIPDPDDAQMLAKIDYAMRQGWFIVIEHSDDPDPRNSYWQTWGGAMFDPEDPAAILQEIQHCRATLANRHIRVHAHDRLGRVVRMSFTVNRPAS